MKCLSGSTCICEHYFSARNSVKDPPRNQLDDERLENSLGVAVSQISSRSNILVLNKQRQYSFCSFLNSGESE
jgi:hypothetical protein